MGKETILIATITQPESVHVLLRICAIGRVPLHKAISCPCAGFALSCAPSSLSGSSTSFWGTSPPVLYLSLSQLRPLCESQQPIGLYNVTSVLWAICCRDKDVLR